MGDIVRVSRSSGWRVLACDAGGGVSMQHYPQTQRGGGTEDGEVSQRYPQSIEKGDTRVCSVLWQQRASYLIAHRGKGKSREHSEQC